MDKSPPGEVSKRSAAYCCRKTILDTGTIPGQTEFLPYFKGYVAFYARDYKTKN